MSIFIGLGTNLGKRAENLKTCLDIFGRNGMLVQSSSIYETAPWGFEKQPSFLNQVAEIDVSLEPMALLDFLKAIETLLGRQPTFRYGPRVIDLDILFYHERIIQKKRLIVPHPLVAERAFVLIPLAEIAPSFRHPQSGKSVLEMLEKVDKTGIHRFSQGKL